MGFELDCGATVKYFIAYLGLRDNAARSNASREPDVATDGRAAADGNAPKDGGAGVNDNIILDNGMAYIAFHQRAMLIHRKTLGTKGHGLIQAYMLAYDSGFAYDYASAVVYKKAAADLCTRMDLDTGGGMGNFGNHARNQRGAQTVQLMREPIMGNGGDAGITDQYFVDASGCRVSLVSGLNVAFQQNAYVWQTFCKCLGNSGCLFPIRVARCVHTRCKTQFAAYLHQ